MKIMKQRMRAILHSPSVQVAIGLLSVVVVIAALWALLYVTGVIVLASTAALHGNARMWALDGILVGNPTPPGPVWAAIGFLFVAVESAALAAFGFLALYYIGKAVTDAFAPTHDASPEGPK